MFSARKRNKLQRTSGKISVTHGFTVIEMLIVIVIMFIVFGTGTAGYRSFQRRKILEGAVSEVKSNLRLTQQMAMSGVKPNDCISAGYKLNAVVFHVDSNNIDYSIVGRCSDGNDYPYNGRAYGLESNYPDVEFDPNPSDVVFNVLGKGVESAITLTLTHKKTGDTHNIDITTGGEIE